MNEEIEKFILKDCYELVSLSLRCARYENSFIGVARSAIDDFDLLFSKSPRYGNYKPLFEEMKQSVDLRESRLNRLIEAGRIAS